MHLKSYECTDIALNMSVRTQSRISHSAFRTAHSTLRRMPLGSVQRSWGLTLGRKLWDS